MSLAIVPGSFDPMTLGHFDLIEKVASRYDEVVVAVMINDAKSYLFDMDTRVEIAKRTLAVLSNVRVVSDAGMLVDLFDRLSADVVCKGFRNETDYAYEMRMAEWNRAHNPRFRTELIKSSGEHRTLSSTKVREMLARGDAPHGAIHPDALPIVMQKGIFRSEDRI